MYCSVYLGTLPPPPPTFFSFFFLCRLPDPRETFSIFYTLLYLPFSCPCLFYLLRSFLFLFLFLFLVFFSFPPRCPSARLPVCPIYSTTPLGTVRHNLRFIINTQPATCSLPTIPGQSFRFLVRPTISQPRFLRRPTVSILARPNSHFRWRLRDLDTTTSHALLADASRSPPFPPHLPSPCDRQGRLLG